MENGGWGLGAGKEKELMLAAMIEKNIKDSTEIHV
jgi:hypothetical protein